LGQLRSISTTYNYTLSFVIKEQVVFPRPGERSPRHGLAKRNAKLAASEVSILRQAGTIQFVQFDRRYKEGLHLILEGADPE
jgi:TetR/AcrR family transcriptional regulator, tetracycline repressor protein